MPQTLAGILNAAIARRIFPGAQVLLARGDQIMVRAAFGTTAYAAEYSRAVTADTLYDLASLTKLFTATAFLIAARESGVDASTRLSHFLPEFQTAEKREIQLRHLLQHTSGIEIAIQSLIHLSPRAWISQIAAAPLTATPGARVLYSCTNFFLLARVIEMLCGNSFDDFLTARVLAPLEMKRTTFYPVRHFSLGEIAPTEIIDGKLLHGVVHDEAARAWQEYSGAASCGNAGLFGTAHDLAKFCRLWCDDGDNHKAQILQRDEMESALNDVAAEENKITRRGWGWQLDAAFYMSDAAPINSFGHAGFTGPTLWCNRSTQEICIVLNNRVYPMRTGPERFPVHRKIARVLLDEPPTHGDTEKGDH